MCNAYASASSQSPQLDKDGGQPDGATRDAIEPDADRPNQRTLTGAVRPVRGQGPAPTHLPSRPRLFYSPPPPHLNPPPTNTPVVHVSRRRRRQDVGPTWKRVTGLGGPLLFWYQRVDVVGRVRVSTRGGIGLGGGAVHHARHVGEEEFVGVAGTHAARLHAGGIRESPDLGGYPAALLGAARDTTRHDTATDGVLSTISACVVVVAFFFFIFFSLRVHAWVQPCNCIQVSGTPP